MKIKKNVAFSIPLLTIIIVISFTSSLLMQQNNIEVNLNNPDNVINSLHKAIEIAEENGDYECCIHPACTMCYLGHWKFEEGTCHCDEAIAEGRDEDVCPECKSGIEKGLCESTAKEKCDLNSEILFKEEI